MGGGLCFFFKEDIHQWFSNLTMDNALGSLLKFRLLSPTPRVYDLVALG